MALSMEQVAARVENLRYRNAERDGRNLDVLAVRKGNIASVYPDFFPDGVDANVVANFIDIVARDLSEVMAPLPAVNCSAANSVSDRARGFADKRTRIASNYFSHADLSVQMYQGADWYLTYGFLPFFIELDEEAKLPRIRLENPLGAYPEFDRYGRCIAFAKRYLVSLAELVSLFPEYEYSLLGGHGYKQDLNTQVEMIRYFDKDQSIIYIPTKDNLVLSQAKNPLGKMMVVVARKPSIDDELRGQFDDILGIQLLRNRFALLAMEAAEKSVQAPIVLPQDVQDHVLVTSVHQLLQDKAYRLLWEPLIHRLSLLKQSLHLHYAMLSRYALKLMSESSHRKRQFVVLTQVHLMKLHTHLRRTSRVITQQMFATVCWLVLTQHRVLSSCYRHLVVD